MNLPETAKLQEIYGETEKSSARFKKHTNMTKQNTSHQQEELRLSEITQITTAAR